MEKFAEAMAEQCVMAWPTALKISPVAVAQFELVRPYWARLSLAFVLLLTSVGAQLIYPRFVSFFIDGALRGIDRMSFSEHMIIMAGLVVVRVGAVTLSIYLFSSAGTLIVFRLRTLLFGAIVRQEIGFFDCQSVGELMNRLSTDVEQLRNVLSRNLALFGQSTLTFVGCLFVMFVLSPLLTVLVLISAPPVAFIARSIGCSLKELSASRQDKLADCAHVAHEVLANIRLVHAHNQESFEQKRYGSSADDALGVSLSCDKLFAQFYGAETLLNTSALLVSFWIGIALVESHRLTVGNLTSFLLYAFMVISSGARTTGIWNDWMQSDGATRRVFELMKRAPRMKAECRRRMPRPKGAVEFCDVNFAYPTRPQRLVLNNFDLSIASGEKIALVGPSGAGKSTVISLLLRFYEPNAGRIRFDGIAADTVLPSELRRHIAIVEQEPALFAGTILENIRYAVPDGEADECEIIRAASHANVHEFVANLPLGYETRVGNRGVQLSGGQKQRIAIARALLRNPRILVLDEATSALDSENEEKVQIAIQRLMEGRTTIIVSHRLSTIAYADRLVVMDGGRVVQMGTQDELLEAKGGLYCTLMRTQLRANGTSADRAPLSGGCAIRRAGAAGAGSLTAIVNARG